MKFRFKIDEKSLFYGLYNDYVRGQTATVSTPINQSKNPNKWHKDIMKLYGSGLESKIIPQELIDKCLNKTTSQANSKLIDFYEFKEIYFDGIKLECDASFGIYIKEEIDQFIINKKGKKVTNTHLGRQKLHYPISLHYNSLGYNVDNTKVLNAILEQNGGFAFVVRGFEYYQDTQTLNFITSLIGPNGIPLSTVFRRQKGVGKKLMIDPNKVVDNDYVVVVEQNSDIQGSTNVSYELINKSRSENGKLGEEFIYELLKEKLTEDNELYHTSLDFPQSPYDMEYIENGEKKYVEVKSTSGTKPIFNMSSGELKFMEKYKDSYKLYMVTEVKEEFPKYKEYTYYDIMKMRKEYPSVRFFA